MSQIGVQKFSRKQQLALTALLSGMSQAEAAEAAEVSLRTCQRWIASPEFSQALGDSIGSAVALAVARLAALSDAAINVLNETLQSKEATISQRLRASNFALLHLIKLGEMSQVITRIEALESRLNGLESPLSNDNNGAYINSHESA